MKKIIIKKKKEKFSYLRYFIFTYFKKYNLYEKFIENDIFYLPFKKRLNKAYLKAIKCFLKEKNITHFLTFDEDIKNMLKNTFSAITGINIYHTIFLEILFFLTKNKLEEYEFIFISDNIKEIKKLMEKSIKKVKAVSVLTEKPLLYESMKEFLFLKYGVTLNIRTKKEKLKKHNKIYINCGSNRVFEKSFFKNVILIDIYKVYEGAYNNVILEAKGKEKEYTKLLESPYSLELAEFLYEDKIDKKAKIVNIKK